MKLFTPRLITIVTASILSISSFAQTTDTTHKQSPLSETQITTPVDSPDAPATTAQQQVAAPPTQNIGSLTGKLVNAQNKPVSYATVTLLHADSSVVNGDLTKDDGSFSITPTGTGSFLVKIESIGITTKVIPVQITADAPDKDLGNVKITSEQNTLKGVTVVGERPLMEMKVDKKVFNVEKNITTAGGSATDVLSNVPSVSVDVDGNVALRNNANVTILIDGKPATLLGGDQASALQSLPAGSIESVEVITNPSAKYDAQGSTGIINIVTKKSNAFGFNGNISLGAGTGDKYNGSLALNVHKGKWNVFLNSNARFNSNYNNTTTDITPAPGSTLIPASHSYEHMQRHFDAVFNTVGASYDINKRNTISFTQNVNVMNFGNTDTSNNKIYLPGSTDLKSMEQRYSHGNGGPLSFSSALDYKGKFKKTGEELDIDATYATTTIHRTQNYITDFNNYSPENMLIANVMENNPVTGTNQTFNGSIDYTDPLFTKNGKLGLGAKSQLYWFNSHNNPEPTIDTPGITNPSLPLPIDSALRNSFNYTQQVEAAYINWNDQYGKFSYQVGLRAEYNKYQGYDYVLSNASYENHYFDLFPSAFVSYQLPAQQSIYLNYSRRTNRPNFFQLLPYIDVSNPAVVSEGNPNLVPEFIHNVELAYTKQDNRGDNFIVSAYYTYTQHLIERITRPVLASDSLPSSFAGSQFTQPVNLASGTTYGLELTGHIQILPIWDATLNFNFFQNKITVGKTADSSYSAYISDNSGFSWFGKINTNIKLPGGFALQLNGNYESAKPIAQGSINPVYWVDVALRKSFLKGKLAVVANCSDIFNTHKSTTNYNLPTYDEVYYRNRETRVGNLTVTYRFGKTANPNGGGRKGKGSNSAQPNQEDRENNLKQGDDDSGGGMGGGGNGGGNGGSGNGGGKGGGAHN